MHEPPLDRVAVLVLRQIITKVVVRDQVSRESEIWLHRGVQHELVVFQMMIQEDKLDVLEAFEFAGFDSHMLA